MQVPTWTQSMFDSHATDWVFESQPRQTQFVKTDNDTYPAKRSATGVGAMSPRKQCVAR